METKEFVITRALATRSAQENLASVWVWPFKTVAGWTTSIDSFESKETTTTNAKVAVNLHQGQLDATLQALHDKTVKVLGLFRTMIEITNPDYQHMVSLLSASAKSRTEIIDEAEELASAWALADTEWTPVTGWTLESFESDIVEAQAKLKVYLDARTAWRSEAGKWNSVTVSLNRDCVAWYNDATHMFPPDSAEGAMIRSMVPTTTDLTPFPSQAEVTVNEAPGAGAYSITLAADHASKFDVFQRLQGETDFLKVGVEVPEGVFQRTGLAAGTYEVKAQARNSRGGGPDSELKTIVVS